MIITASNSKGFKKINCIDDTKIKKFNEKNHRSESIK
jgi:hypothetical protein